MKKRRIAVFVRTAFCALVVLGATVAETSAQSDGRRALGYGFVAPGAARSTATLHVGGGGEGIIYKGLGAGAEVGYLGAFESFGGGFGIFSANGSYHFVTSNSDQKWVPFLTGGYSLIFRGDTANMVNFGGGVNYWFARRAGLRLEFRDHVLTNGGTHFYGARVGFTFR